MRSMFEGSWKWLLGVRTINSALSCIQLRWRNHGPVMTPVVCKNSTRITSCHQHHSANNIRSPRSKKNWTNNVFFEQLIIRRRKLSNNLNPSKCFLSGSQQIIVFVLGLPPASGHPKSTHYMASQHFDPNNLYLN